MLDIAGIIEEPFLGERLHHGVDGLRIEASIGELRLEFAGAEVPAREQRQCRLPCGLGIVRIVDGSGYPAASPRLSSPRSPHRDHRA